MPEPPVHVEEIAALPRGVEGVETSVAAFVGHARGGSRDAPTEVRAIQDFERGFGDLDCELGLALRQFFGNGGRKAIVVAVDAAADKSALLGASAGTGLQALADLDFNLLCIPGTFDLPDDDAAEVARAALALCRTRRAFALIDVPRGRTASDIGEWTGQLAAAGFGAAYFPALIAADPAQPGGRRVIAPCASVAGVYARTDIERGVWKAPANECLRGVLDAASHLDADASDRLMAQHVNPLRPLRDCIRVWGARTLGTGNGSVADYRYVSVRRLDLYIEQSLLRGTQWAVFEPNGEPLWQRLRHDTENFLMQLFRNGALQGAKPEEAYFVKCDRSTMTTADLEAGLVNLQLGFAPVRPSEFLLLNIQHKASPPTR